MLASPRRCDHVAGVLIGITANGDRVEVFAGEQRIQVVEGNDLPAVPSAQLGGGRKGAA